MLTNFHNKFNQAIEHIQSVLSTPEGEYNYEQALLANWMLTSGVNPYEYLPDEWAGSLSCAQSFSALLHSIHHAMYDDGDITFITVDGCPRIVFFWAKEDNFEDLVLSKHEKRLKETDCYEPVIEIMPLDVQNFIDTKIQFEKEQEERWTDIRQKMSKLRERGLLS